MLKETIIGYYRLREHLLLSLPPTLHTHGATFPHFYKTESSGRLFRNVIKLVTCAPPPVLPIHSPAHSQLTRVAPLLLGSTFFSVSPCTPLLFLSREQETENEAILEALRPVLLFRPQAVHSPRGRQPTGGPYDFYISNM